MTTTTYVDWDAARIALGLVAQVFVDSGEDTIPADELPGLLHGVHNYNLIPLGVRNTLENLTPEEQIAVKKVIGNLASNHFYIEGGPGGLIFY